LISGFATQTRPIPRATVEEVLRDFDLAVAGVEDTDTVDRQPNEPAMSPESKTETAQGPTRRFQVFGRKWV
jgi:hypothetical protein